MPVLKYRPDEASSWQTVGITADGYSKEETDALLAGKADLSTQQTVEKKNVPTKRVTLTASELPNYLDSLPKLLTDYIAITVSGTLDTMLKLTGFYGSGYIRIAADSTNGFTAQKEWEIVNCNVDIYLDNIQFTLSQKTKASFLYISNCGYVAVDGCVFTGLGTDVVYNCFSIARRSMVLINNCTVSGFETAVLAASNCIVTIYGSSSSFTGNKNGAYIWHGGIIMLYGDMSSTLGGSSNKKQGGLIVKSDSTLL